MRKLSSHITVCVCVCVCEICVCIILSELQIAGLSIYNIWYQSQGARNCYLFAENCHNALQKNRTKPTG